MKYVIGAISLSIIVGLVLFYRENSNKTVEIKNEIDYCKEIVEKLALPYEIINNAPDADFVMKKYLELLEESTENGYTPLMIIPSSIMLDVVSNDLKLDDYDYTPQSIIKSSESIDVSKLLESRLKASLPVEEENYDVFGEFKVGKPLKQFQSIMDYSTNKPYEEIIILKIPTSNAWEMPAYVPMGGYNGCPVPEEQLAVFKYWYEKYGAIPAVATYEEWELYVPNPIVERQTAEIVALEQFSFCSDIVHQGVGTVNELAGTVLNSNVWYYWWD